MYFFFNRLLKNNLLIFFNKKSDFSSEKRFSVLLPTTKLRFLSLHLKLSSIFFLLQSLDFFAYQTNELTSLLNCFVFYSPPNFATIFLFFFYNKNYLFFSIDDFFYNFWWLEREVFELSGVFFFLKIDSRNLMLEFNNFLKPLLKEFPSFGLVEFYFSTIVGFMKQVVVSLQL